MWIGQLCLLCSRPTIQFFSNGIQFHTYFVTHKCRPLQDMQYRAAPFEIWVNWLFYTQQKSYLEQGSVHSKLKWVDIWITGISELQFRSCASFQQSNAADTSATFILADWTSVPAFLAVTLMQFAQPAPFPNLQIPCFPLTLLPRSTVWLRQTPAHVSLKRNLL